MARNAVPRSSGIASTVQTKYLRIGRDDLLLAGDQRRLPLALEAHDLVIDLARQKAQRQPDHAGFVRQHPLDGEMGLAGVGGAEDGRDPPRVGRRRLHLFCGHGRTILILARARKHIASYGIGPEGRVKATLHFAYLPTRGILASNRTIQSVAKVSPQSLFQSKVGGHHDGGTHFGTRFRAVATGMYLPNYQIGEAARYAHISAQTVAAWHKGADDRRTLSSKEHRAALSYMQLIEVAVVAAFRRAGIKLRDIKAARAYVSQVLRKEFPFSEYEFKTNGKDLIIDHEHVDGKNKGKGKLLLANRGGQLAWREIVGTLNDFEYGDGIAIRWRVGGKSSPVIIDPRIAFGAPTVAGTPTWIIKGRRDAGETIEDISEDFGIKRAEVRKAIEFEVPELNKRGAKWMN